MSLISITDENDVFGALVLGKHSLHFAKGPAIGQLKTKGKAFQHLGYDCIYAVNDQETLQSFLEIDGVEQTVESINPTESGFTLDLSFLAQNPRQKVLMLDPGLVAMIAPTSWGKSTVTYNGIVPSLQSADHDIVAYNFLEVFETSGDVSIIGTSRHVTLLKGILTQLVGEPGVIVIDSMRAFIYGPSVGGTGTAGLDQYFSIQLTALSNLLAVTGHLMIATINPMIGYDDEKDKKRYDEIVDQLVASTTCAIVGRGPRVARIFPRGFLNPTRPAYDLIIKDLDDAKSGPVSMSQRDAEPAQSVVRGSVTAADQSLLASSRRLLSAGATTPKVKKVAVVSAGADIVPEVPLDISLTAMQQAYWHDKDLQLAYDIASKFESTDRNAVALREQILKDYKDAVEFNALLKDLRPDSSDD